VNPSMEAWTSIHASNSWLTFTYLPHYYSHFDYNLNHVHRHDKKMATQLQ